MNIFDITKMRCGCMHQFHDFHRVPQHETGQSNVHRRVSMLFVASSALMVAGVVVIMTTWRATSPLASVVPRVHESPPSSPSNLLVQDQPSAPPSLARPPFHEPPFRPPSPAPSAPPRRPPDASPPQSAPPLQLQVVPPADVREGWVKEQLNARFVNGQASNNLYEAGVLVHVLDGGLLPDGGSWFGHRGYISASLMHLRKWDEYSQAHHTWTGVYGGKTGALVISPRSKVLCSYPQDSGSLSWTAAKTGLAGCGPRPCSLEDAPFPLPGTLGSSSGYPCYFPPDMFDHMLETFDACDTAYNEVIISAAPGDLAIEAVIDLPKASFPSDWYDSILEHYGLNVRQLPRLNFGPGMKGPAPLFV